MQTKTRLMLTGLLLTLSALGLAAFPGEIDGAAMPSLARIGERVPSAFCTL